MVAGIRIKETFNVMNVFNGVFAVLIFLGMMSYFAYYTDDEDQQTQLMALSMILAFIFIFGVSL